MYCSLSFSSSPQDKTAARATAIKCGVPVVPGTDGPVSTVAEAEVFVASCGLPIIIKAAMGGGGKGMRVVREAGELAGAFESASSEALASFGDGTVFLERYVENPRHIEVQILGDNAGNLIHLFDRDCSVQRRHQKVVEIAPSSGLKPGVREQLFKDAITLGTEARYRNAGTVEFLVGPDGKHYFIEINPRIQVEHTVTEEATGIDLVQSQIRIASGLTLPELGLSQDTVSVKSYAIQCRITTEDPAAGFIPDTGRLTVYRTGEGNGIRTDSVGFPGARISPHYDSMLAKVTARARSFNGCTSKLRRALREYRIRGVTTNIPYLIRVLSDPEFQSGVVDTSFIDKRPELLAPAFSENRDRANKALQYLANLRVNGHPASLGATGPAPSTVDPTPPLPPPATKSEGSRSEDLAGLRQVFLEGGPEGFARAVRAHKGLLLTDTTWRDAHQSLLATRMRTSELLHCADATAAHMGSLYSLENWGGATFDVAMRFLHECPWDRLEQMREQVPNIPFQMLLRGANAVGYTSYPDNAVHAFCEQAVHSGMDVFRIFDSLNYIENMKLGIDAVGGAGGVVEAAICYTGDVTAEDSGKYDLDYYLEYVRQLDSLGIHVLCIKDMAGLLKPKAATLLVSSIRREFPHLPIHVHTHDTAGTGVASMLACAEAGADAVDCAMDGMSGITSQPSMGAIVNTLQGTDLDTGLDPAAIADINTYWEQVRGLYAPFESGQLSGSADVYQNEIPGGQYTNLLFQSKQLGLGEQWPEIKRTYAAANRLLGDIPKVTPSSKVVGDLAQFMVTNQLTEAAVVEQAPDLSFPVSVVEYFQGFLGVPPGGFPEPLRSKITQGRTWGGGDSAFFEGRPGAELEDYDFEGAKAALEIKYPRMVIRNQDVLSHCMYPAVFDEWQEYRETYGDVSRLPTRAFLQAMEVGDEVAFNIEKGKTIYAVLLSVGEVNHEGQREVVFELNGEARSVFVDDESSETTVVKKEKADPTNECMMGAPMPGVVVGIKVKVGDTVEKGDPVLVLSAMKMETVVASAVSGKIARIIVDGGDSVAPGDLLVEVQRVERRLRDMSERDTYSPVF